ncbi:MAG TPA: hypothetical protein VFX56_08760, partial [Nitrospira sp.]|nr:hypothetical protein [Nitrospira sp.]
MMIATFVQGNCRIALLLAGLVSLSEPTVGWSADTEKEPPTEQHESLSLADAAIRALQSNLDISISRHTKE